LSLRLCLVAVVALAGLAAFWCWDHRHWWIAHNFRVVVPGRIYASGYLYARPLERIVRKYEIRTVISLRQGGDAADQAEQQKLAELGVRFIRMPLAHSARTEQLLESVERVADLLADKRLYPVLVHCWAGKHRTGAVIAIYRVKHRGWPQERAIAEMHRHEACSDQTWWPVHVLSYYCAREQLARAFSEKNLSKLRRKGTKVARARKQRRTARRNPVRMR
jgi:protein tyrosine phosphatase (PTP) superfamily phosphohydrolase (DUF442 family)